MAEVKIEKYKGRNYTSVSHCSMCDKKRRTVSVLSTEVIPKEYDRPMFHIVFCYACLQRMSRTVLNSKAVEEVEESVDDQAEDDS